ncbi:MAG: hypothetical protein IPJ77_00305 [Planctomycetes bacterium]|nr:hypothetical protein [Planctomycetota bacterium]
MNASMRSFVLVPAVFAAAGTLYFLGRWTAQDGVRVQPESDTPIAAAPRVEEAAPADLARAVATEAEAPEVRRGTVRELLEEHYGKSWAEIEPLLDPRHLDPDAQARLLPWETVAAEFRRQIVHDSPQDRAGNVSWTLEWPDGRDRPDWYGGTLNPEKKPLSQVDVQNLERLATEYDSRLTDLADELCKTLPRCMADQWDKGGYTRSPLVETLDARPTGGGAKGEFRKLIASHGGGWRVNFDFESQNYPDLESLSIEIRAMKRERVERVREYIASL